MNRKKRDAETHRRIIRRPRGGTCVYKQQGCRSCGVNVVNNTCGCVYTKRDKNGKVLSRHPGRPFPGMIFAAYTGGE